MYKCTCFLKSKKIINYYELHGYFLFYRSFIINYFIFFQAQNVQVCEIDPEVTSKLKTFRFRKEKNIAALMCKYIYISFILLQEVNTILL